MSTPICVVELTPNTLATEPLKSLEIRIFPLDENVINPRSAINRRNQYAKTHVGKGASIGANATIVCGHDIGAYAFIGAGAVVTKTVPAFALVVGNPAKQLGWVGEYGHRLDFNKDGIAFCLESNQEYKLTEGIVVRVK